MLNRIKYLLNIYLSFKKAVLTTIYFFFLVGLLFLTSCAFKPIYAQEGPIKKRMITKTYVCAKHDFLTNDLQIRSKELRVGWGVSNHNQMIEIFINKDKGTWTIIFTGTDGMSCGLVGGSQGLTFENTKLELNL